MNVSIITIGDEILIGQVIDTNSAWMAGLLNEAGFAVREILSVADENEEIKDALQRSLSKSHVVLVTGGLGPTDDDLTIEALCEYFGVEAVFHEESFERIKKMFGKRNIVVTNSHRAQCHLPANATVLNNDMGTAPGMWIEHDGKVLVSMPGVPYEMKHLMEERVMPRLRALYAGPPVKHLTIRTAGTGESVLEEKLRDVTTEMPKEVKLAFLPDIGQVRLRYSVHGLPVDKTDTILARLKTQTLERIGEYVYAKEDISLEEWLGTVLKERNLKLVTCESCTGGFLAHLITSIAGSSDYFLGSIVSYSNELKMQLLDVPSTVLEQHGAVSRETAEAMAKGGLQVTGADIAVSITGIAGPGGGTTDKPVGTVWIAAASGNKVISEKFLFTKDRKRNIQYSAVNAMVMLKNLIQSI